MAYFLDPALAALAAGTPSATRAPARILPNKFAKDCSACSLRVEAGRGRLVKSGKTWQVFHLAC